MEFKYNSKKFKIIYGISFLIGSITLLIISYEKEKLRFIMSIAMLLVSLFYIYKIFNPGPEKSEKVIELEAVKHLNNNSIVIGLVSLLLVILFIMGLGTQWLAAGIGGGLSVVMIQIIKRTTYNKK